MNSIDSKKSLVLTIVHICAIMYIVVNKLHVTFRYQTVLRQAY